MPTGIYDWCLEYKENNSSIERERSNRGGYQSLVSNNFNSFPYTDYIIKQLNFLPRFNLQSWWININNKGNYNITHIHPGSELSIVWHITDSDNSLVLEDLIQLIDYPMNLGKHNNKEVMIHIGPYGKYMKYNNKNYRIPQRDVYILEDCIRKIF